MSTPQEKTPQSESRKTMMVFRARSELTVRVDTGGGIWRTLHFAPTSDGGSRLATADPKLQRALRTHSGFGRLFSVEPIEQPSAP
ncbi:MAG: hypothetical protein NC336_06565 [Clostridium sp.]|nr:hypothetical protein [Clostridium sp.]